MFYFHPYLGKIPILTNIFQMGWTHQPENHWKPLEITAFEAFHLDVFARGFAFERVIE